MIRRRCEIGIHQPLAAGRRTSLRTFRGDEHGIDVFENERIIDLQNPAVHGSVIYAEQAEVFRLLFVVLTISPSLERRSAVIVFLILQVKRIENEELFLCVINTTVGAACLAVVSHIVYINDMQITRAE